MIPKFDLKPQDQSKITLFANKAEAIVFWLALAGLIFLAIVSLFRFLTNKQAEIDKEVRKELLVKIETIEKQNQALQAQIDSLKVEFDQLRGNLSK
ncbi:MAG: hypothetical protein ACE5HO_19015 [bacterium]